MADITREDFAKAIVAAVTTVRHLHSELAHLYVRMRDLLADDPDSMRLLGSPQLRPQVRSERIIIRDVHMAVFKLREQDDPDELDEELDEAEDEGEDEEKPGKKRTPIEFTSSESLLAVRIDVRDPRNPAGFQPQLRYAVLNGWAVGRDQKKPPRNTILAIRQYMVRRLPLILDHPVGKNIMTNASVIGKGKRNRRLSCTIATPIHSKLLFELDGPETIESLVKGMKDLFRSCQTPVADPEPV